MQYWLVSNQLQKANLVGKSSEKKLKKVLINGSVSVTLKFQYVLKARMDHIIVIFMLKMFCFVLTLT